MESRKAIKGGGRLPFSISMIVFCALAFATLLLFTEDLRAIDKPRTCSGQERTGKSTEKTVKVLPPSRRPFDRETCDVVDGSWVFDRSVEPPYTDTSCPYLDEQVECVKNGRPDKDYQHWQWHLEDCVLPRFDGAAFLEKLRGKKLMFVGDSLQRGQWLSLVCLVQSHLAPEHKSLHRGRSLSVFQAKEYNATIEFYWAPYLVESNSDDPIVTDIRKRTIRVDSIAKHAEHWVGADILVFNTFVWWTTGFKIRCRWGSSADGDEGYEELDADVAYRFGLKTWANWVDSNVNPDETRVFFTTMSPTHMRSADWHSEGIRCYNETRPIMERGYHGTGSNRKIMEAVEGVIGRMKVPVVVLNITQLSEYRVDGHASVYTETEGKILTEKEKSDPQRYADCIHWCLPGVPDTWNQLLNAYL